MYESQSVRLVTECSESHWLALSLTDTVSVSGSTDMAESDSVKLTLWQWINAEQVVSDWVRGYDWVKKRYQNLQPWCSRINSCVKYCYSNIFPVIFWIFSQKLQRTSFFFRQKSVDREISVQGGRHIVRSDVTWRLLTGMGAITRCFNFGHYSLSDGGGGPKWKLAFWYPVSQFF